MWFGGPTGLSTPCSSHASRVVHLPHRARQSIVTGLMTDPQSLCGVPVGLLHLYAYSFNPTADTPQTQTFTSSRPLHGLCPKFQSWLLRFVMVDMYGVFVMLIDPAAIKDAHCASVVCRVSMWWPCSLFSLTLGS